MPAQDVTVTANFTEEIPTYTLTMVADPGEGGTATDVTNTGPYAAGTVVSISAEANEGYVFNGWIASVGTFGDASLEGTTFTMPAQDVTVTANFTEENIITLIKLGGWNNPWCNPGFEDTLFFYQEPYPETEDYDEIKPDSAWLTVDNPNLKSVRFKVNIAADGIPVVNYKHTINIIINEEDTKSWSSSSSEGILTGPDLNGEYVFSSTCIEIPGSPPSNYPHHFYIEISIGEGIYTNTYIVHIW